MKKKKMLVFLNMHMWPSADVSKIYGQLKKIRIFKTQKVEKQHVLKIKPSQFISI